MHMQDGKKKKVKQGGRKKERKEGKNKMNE
jgi:hypothetical protein